MTNRKEKKRYRQFPDINPESEKRVTHLTPNAINVLSQKKFGDQVSYDRPFGNEFYSETGIFEAEEMLARVNEEGFCDRFGEPYSDVGDLLYALEIENAGMHEDEETIDELHTFIGDCTRCRLCETRTEIVQSGGNPYADLMFVGEAPGKVEDELGRSFVGPAGQLLTKIIEAIGFAREDVFLSNVVRCRPPENHHPTSREISTCQHFLIHEIAIIRPLVIVTLGITATRTVLGLDKPLENLRGRFYDFHDIKVMPTYHPAYLLRDPSKKLDTWNDMKMVRKYMADIKSESL